MNMSSFDKLGSWLSRQKASLTEAAIEHLVRSRVARYGELIEFSVDLERGTAHCRILLKGDADPVSVSIEEFAIVTEGAQPFFVVRKASASREWLNLLIADFVRERPFAIP